MDRDTYDRLQRYRSDPASFRAELVVPGARGAVRFGDVMADFQARDFASLDTALKSLAAGEQPVPNRFWWERTKGASKDSDAAVSLLWLLAFSPRPLTCQVGAGDADQADELRKAAKAVLRLNPWLAELVKVQSWSIFNPDTDAKCDIITSDVMSSHGARPDLLILNELSHIPKQEFAENLADNASKVPHGLVLICTNAGFTPSWQWDWRENARTSPRWCWCAVTEPAPWLDPAEIADARKRNSALRFARLWGGQWVRGTGDALSGDDITACVHPRLPRYDTWRAICEDDWIPLAGGLDLGVSRDHSGAAIIAGKLGRLRLLHVESWAPPLGGKLNLVALENAVFTLHQRFRPALWLADVWQAELMVQQLRGRGLPIEGVPFTVGTLQSMATQLLECFTSRTIELYDDPGLIADLHALRLLDRGTSFRLDAPRNKSGHGDKGTGLLLALLGAARYSHLRQVTWSALVHRFGPSNGGHGSRVRQDDDGWIPIPRPPGR